MVRRRIRRADARDVVQGELAPARLGCGAGRSDCAVTMQLHTLRRISVTLFAFRRCGSPPTRYMCTPFDPRGAVFGQLPGALSGVGGGRECAGPCSAGPDGPGSPAPAYLSDALHTRSRHAHTGWHERPRFLPIGAHAHIGIRHSTLRCTAWGGPGRRRLFQPFCERVASLALLPSTAVGHVPWRLRRAHGAVSCQPRQRVHPH